MKLLKLVTGRSMLPLKAACAIVALVVSLLGPGHAFAILGTCRDDPVVLLSNGAEIDMTTGVNDVATDVQNVSYTLHAPAGTSVVAFVESSGLLGPKETFHFFPDDAPGVYDTTTVVSSGQSVSATATTTVVSALGINLGSRSASGLSGTNLTVQIRPLL